MLRRKVLRLLSSKVKMTAFVFLFILPLALIYFSTEVATPVDEVAALASAVFSLKSKLLHYQLKQIPVINPHPFKFLLNPASLCEGKNVFMIAIVHSAPANLRKRQAIRNTWGNKKQIPVVFFTGYSSDIRVMDTLMWENRTYGDIAMENFVDSYRNLTYKAVAAVKWVTTFCRAATYVLKTDDDMFVNVPLLFKYVRSSFELLYGRKSLIACFLFVNRKVVRSKELKWYVTKKEYANDIYEPYCLGAAYVMSPDVAEAFYRSSLTTPFFWIDDVYLTGIIANKLNITQRPFNDVYLFLDQNNENQVKDLDKYVFFHTSAGRINNLGKYFLSKKRREKKNNNL